MRFGGATRGAAAAFGIMLATVLSCSRPYDSGETPKGSDAAVEASSDALIERLRSVITDESGVYKVINLRPGTYTLTFVLPGFKTFKREQVELAANFTATINAVMSVGAFP